MKKLVVPVFLLLAVALLMGCGTKVTVTDKETKIEVDTPEGKVESEVSDRIPTEEELGLPIYPDAELDKESSGTVDTTTEEGTASFKGVNLITDDPFSEVVAWYREKLSGMPGFLDMTLGQDSGENALFSVGTEGEAKIVGVEKAPNGKTKISVASATR